MFELPPASEGFGQMETDELVPKLLRAGLDGDRRTLEALGMQAIKRFRKANPSLAEQLSSILSYSGVGASTMRASGMVEPPRDADNRLPLAVVDQTPHPPVNPVFTPSVQSEVDEFLRERSSAERLLANGIVPSRSLLLVGPPGVGKTLLGTLIADRLKLPLITLDLASAISSYLGKTGQNLHSVLDYARSRPSVLFLDEFDAIAKRRDDPSDLGELKRIVNVLLQQLDDWPVSSIVLAATNHPQLLDPAIWRRFDRVINLELPETAERESLFRTYLYGVEVPDHVIRAIASLSGGYSPADISKVAERIKRGIILGSSSPITSCFSELQRFGLNGKLRDRGDLVRAVRAAVGNTVTIRELAHWLGMSHSTVSYHLKSERKKRGSEDD